MEDPAAGEDGDAIMGIRIFKLVLFGIVLLAGLFLNILMFLVVTRKRVRHRRTAKSFIRLIQNLACADLLFLFFTIPFDSAWWLNSPTEFPYGGAACKIFWPLQNASFEAIALTYVLLSFHRTYGIKQALFAQMNDLFMMFIVFVIWIGSLLTVLPYVIFLNYDAARLSCHEMWPLLDDRRAYSGVLFVVQYILPLMILLTMYIVGKRELDVAVTRDQVKVQRKARHRRVNFMLIIYLLVFAFLSLPEHICRFLLDFQGANMKPYFFDIMKLLYVLPLLLTITNPILFFKFNQEFRSDMWYFLGCKCCKGKDATDGGRRTSASFSIELPPPGEAKVPYSDIHQAPSSATTMERAPHVRDSGSIGEATYPGRGSRQPSHQGSISGMGPRSSSQERFSYHGSRDPIPMTEKPPRSTYPEGPPRTGSRQDIPQYSTRYGSREQLPAYDQPKGYDRYGSHDSLPRKEPYPPRGSREPSYHGSRDSLPRKEPPRYEEPYRDPPYRPPSREYLNREDRPPSRGSRGSREAPPYRQSSREDLRRDDYDDDADSDAGSEML
ncbi:neuropeptide Y receptor type 6 [Exaiptasia diaphana]|uniref:G-protein coupled receptors family 1 profile domain-containing protein n=1 Tax=Exaiptasia diaphana TaxID=2652724 RepID=A0A913X7H3_EXADI|nr:neuropeptide Y receptor type 6 [Exaiptasia diaphana]KXJ14807.1 Neuropeptide FF receptor 1 [Exaiptasia diaphana]